MDLGGPDFRARETTLKPLVGAISYSLLSLDMLEYCLTNSCLAGWVPSYRQSFTPLWLVTPALCSAFFILLLVWSGLWLKASAVRRKGDRLDPPPAALLASHVQPPAPNLFSS